jgi:EAL domain-containing protein (putative c-di-GMP-specific phosphodiesterase class I)
MGNTLKIKVLGKSVEKASQVDFLKKHKCDEVQGFFYDYPAPADQVFEKIKAHRK